MRSRVAAKLFAACLCCSLFDLAVLDIVVGPAAFAEGATALDAQGASVQNATDSAPAPPVTAVPTSSASELPDSSAPSAPSRSSGRRVVARFDSDQPSTDDTELRALAAAMLADPTAEIVLEGHTDQRGDPERNRMLSVERAKWAQARLVELGVSSSRIAVVGIGAERPREIGDDDAAIAENRRVEVRWITGTPPPENGDR
jgi:peptidoglycan-associated lipoprotein